jgi:hypothetical protein
VINKFIRRKMKVAGEALPFIGYGKSSRETIIPEIFLELGYKVGAEIGVQRGTYSKVLCDKIPGLKLYCVDPWIPYPVCPSLGGMDKCFRIATTILSSYDVILLKKTSQEALKDIPDSSLDFVYIDGLHDFDNVMLDIIGWSKKVRIGGIVSGHDYFHHRGVGVVIAVDAYVRSYNIQQWFITRDYPPSWFWVKS